MKPDISWKDTGVWTFSPTGGARRGTRAGRGPDIPAAFRSALKEAGAEIIAERIAQVDAKRLTRRGPSVEGAARLPVPDVETDVGEKVALLLQHESGALQIKLPAVSAAAPARRGARGKRRVRHHFEVVLTLPEDLDDEEDSSTGVRRSSRTWLKKIIKVVLVKVVDKLAQKAVPWLVAKWEKSSWAKAKRPLGWLRVSAAGGKLQVAPVSPDRGVLGTGPRLLLLHGTFSHTAGGFGDLAGSDFFQWASARYGGRIFAFNHFTMSETPQENAAALLEALPASGGPWEFDVITHSRGGLVLRSAVEPGLRHSVRFQPGRVVLTASPNAGTPLATPGRWEEVLTFWANLGDLFPNALTEAVSWVADALTWIAGRVGEDIPGLAAMNMDGEFIGTLQQPSAAAAGEWSALTANFHPDRSFWLRLADAGIDRFFAGANDLVVPSEGGWQIDRRLQAIPAARIGCFGAGGNLLTDHPEHVHHVNFFRQAETVEFLKKALNGQAQGLPVFDPAVPLPARSGRRSAAPAVIAPVKPAAVVQAEAAATTVPASVVVVPASPSTPGLRPGDDPDTLSILIMGGSREHDLTPEPDEVNGDDEPAGGKSGKRPKPRRAKQVPPKLLAAFGNAHVLTDFTTRNEQGGEPGARGAEDGRYGTRFGRVFGTTRRIREFCDGESDELPDEDKLLELGRTLFELLMRPEVLRLYDLARSRRAGRPLYVNFTSQIPWVADNPWEFVFDEHAGGCGRPGRTESQSSAAASAEGGPRGVFLSTGEVIFTRNVLTPRPSALTPREGPLRILVVAAQPLNAAKLSIEEERELLRRGFDDLAVAGLAVVKVLPRATPVLLQQSLAVESFDVVHFISHGVFDDENQAGALLFEDERGNEWMLSEEEVCLLLCHRGIRLVFLNACETATAGRRRFNSGLTSSLVESGIPAVVGNQFSVDDLSATVFAQHFYWHLAHGLTIGEAAREARIAVRCYIPGQVIDWAVPVVYAGDPRLRLCSRFGSPALLEKSVAPAPRPAPWEARRRSSAGQFRIAVWDVGYALPGLRHALDRLNAVQNVFLLELVDGSLPMGLRAANITFSGDKRTALDGPAAAGKLRNAPAHLGVDLLACIVDQPIRDDEYEDLYGYASDDRRVAFYSVTEYKMKRRAGDSPEVRAANDHAEARAIAMMISTAAAWSFTSLETHMHGPASCPMYFDENIEMGFLTKRMQFCAACRRKFKVVNGKANDRAMLAALDALLGAFY
jgi:hypothetical protein